MHPLRLWIIEKLGGHVDGFRDLDEAIQYIRDTNDIYRKRELLTLAVKRLFNTIGPDDILKKMGNSWSFQGRAIPHEKIVLLKAEAELFIKSDLYMMLSNELKYLSNKKMYFDSVGDIDIIAGKLLVYYVDIVKTFLEKKLLERGSEK